ncbi:MAG: helix-turn-helix transcriptional regulator [Candidatus Tectomicrobia bacterium]|nr:helix-turn-helix transcriptional regulator [Candidatus Tectomicrobia bacterium]
MHYDMQIDKSPAGQILKLLQQRGTLSIKDIEIALGVTATAVRQQLTALRAEDLVASKTVREKRGRPHAVYGLTEKGQALFAQGYENLALVMLEEMLELAEPILAKQLLHRVSMRLGQHYAQEMRGEEVAERLQELVDRLQEHGIISQVVDEEDGFFMLTEYGCPYYSVARQHREICDMEIEAMEQALGAEVTLCQSQLDGHHGCQFQVKK